MVEKRDIEFGMAANNEVEPRKIWQSYNKLTIVLNFINV